MLKAIFQSDINSVWGKVENNIIESCLRSRGKYRVADVKEMLDTAHAQLWIWESATAFAVIVTKIVQYPQNKCLSIWIATGNNFEEWAIKTVKIIENFAIVSECSAMELIARPGWEKILTSYDKTHVYLEKSL